MRTGSLHTSRCLADEAGDMLIEVVVSALLLGIIVVGAFAGFDAGGHASAQERARSIANQLAIQDEEHLRGAQITDLNSINGTYWSTTVDGTKFTVTRSAVLENATGGSSSCSTSGIANVNYVQTTSAVTWSTKPVGSPAVQQSSLITPPNGSGLIVEVGDWGSFDPNTGLPLGRPTSAVLVTVTGPQGSSSPITKTNVTDIRGCTSFVGLPDGTYQLTLQGTGDYGTSMQQTYLDTGVAVTTGLTTVKQYAYTLPGTILATFQSTNPADGTTINGVGGDSIFVINGAITPTPKQSYVASGGLGPANYVNQITTGLLFPYNWQPAPPQGIQGSPYTVYAGTCTADNPSSVGGPAPPTATLLPGQQQAALSGPVSVPPLKILIYTGGSGNTNNLSNTLPTRAVVTDMGCAATRTYTSSSGQLSVPKTAGASGTLTNPDLPYGKYLVCVTTGAQYYLATATPSSTGSVTLTNGSATGGTGYIFTSAANHSFPSGYSQSNSC